MTSSTASESLRVLLIEDEDVDQMVLERAFRRSELDVSLTMVRDGQAGLNRLRGVDSEGPLERPHLVILDLNMPRMGGIEFLDQLRADPDLKRTVVFVLTTSGHEQDRTDCYDRGVAGFIVKQSVGAQSLSLAHMLERYWSLVELPMS